MIERLAVKGTSTMLAQPIVPLNSHEYSDKVDECACKLNDPDLSLGTSSHSSNSRQGFLKRENSLRGSRNKKLNIPASVKGTCRRSVQQSGSKGRSSHLSYSAMKKIKDQQKLEDEILSISKRTLGKTPDELSLKDSENSLHDEEDDDLAIADAVQNISGGISSRRLEVEEVDKALSDEGTLAKASEASYEHEGGGSIRCSKALNKRCDNLRDPDKEGLTKNKKSSSSMRGGSGQLRTMKQTSRRHMHVDDKHQVVAVAADKIGSGLSRSSSMKCSRRPNQLDDKVQLVEVSAEEKGSGLSRSRSMEERCIQRRDIKGGGSRSSKIEVKKQGSRHRLQDNQEGNIKETQKGGSELSSAELKRSQSICRLSSQKDGTDCVDSSSNHKSIDFRRTRTVQRQQSDGLVKRVLVKRTATDGSLGMRRRDKPKSIYRTKSAELPEISSGLSNSAMETIKDQQESQVEIESIYNLMPPFMATDELGLEEAEYSIHDEEDDDLAIAQAVRKINGGISGRRLEVEQEDEALSDNDTLAIAEAAYDLRGGDSFRSSKAEKKICESLRRFDKETTMNEKLCGAKREGSSKPTMTKQASRRRVYVEGKDQVAEIAAADMIGSGSSRNKSMEEQGGSCRRRRVPFDVIEEAALKLGSRNCKMEMEKQGSRPRLQDNQEDNIEETNKCGSERSSAELKRSQSIRRLSSQEDDTDCVDSPFHKSKDYRRTRTVQRQKPDEVACERGRVKRVSSDGYREKICVDKRKNLSKSKSVELPPPEKPVAKQREQKRKSPDCGNRRLITKHRVRFREDPESKNGVATTYVESEGPISPEERSTGWYNGRNGKLFKSLQHNEVIEARESKENAGYREHFAKVFKACDSDAIDFAWQTIMDAEHQTNKPNSAVLLAEARYRGCERDIFPEILLRKRIKAIKAVIAAHEATLFFMTMSPDDQADSVRTASLKHSQPFRRFARIMAKGDSLLVAGWDHRVVAADDDDEAYGGAKNTSCRSLAVGSDHMKRSRHMMYANNGSSSSSSSRNLGAAGEGGDGGLHASTSCRNNLIMKGDSMHASCRHLLASSSSNGTTNSRNKSRRWNKNSHTAVRPMLQTDATTSWGSVTTTTTTPRTTMMMMTTTSPKQTMQHPHGPAVKAAAAAQRAKHRRRREDAAY